MKKQKYTILQVFFFLSIFFLKSLLSFRFLNFSFKQTLISFLLIYKMIK